MSQQVEQAGEGWKEGKGENHIQNNDGARHLFYGSESHMLEL